MRGITFNDVKRYIDGLAESGDLDTVKRLESEINSALTRVYDVQRKKIEDEENAKFMAISDNFAPLAERLEAGDDIDDYSINLAIRTVAREFFYGENPIQPMFAVRAFRAGSLVNHECMTYVIELVRRCPKAPQFYRYWKDSIYYSDDGVKYLKSLYEYIYGIMVNAYDMYLNKARRSKGDHEK